MVHLALCIVALAAGYAQAASIPECCKEKTVGGVPYVLVDTSDTMQYGCMSDCVFEKKGNPGPRFCFKEGDLEVVCGEDGGSGKMLNPVVLLTGGITGKVWNLDWNSVEVFDPLGSCNKELENLTSPSRGHSTDFFNGEIIMCGGSRCHFLDQTQRFIEHSQLTLPHYGHVAAVVGDTLTIVAGDDSTIVETWNGSEWEARSVDEIEDLQYQSCMDAISKDTLLMVGGSSNSNKTNKMMKYYKADKDQDGVWERMEDFPGTPGDGLGCAFIKTPEGDSFLIAGGFGDQRTSFLYNIQKNNWEEVGRLSYVRYTGKIVVVDGKVLMLGGWYGPIAVEEYNVETKTWSPIEQEIKQSRGSFDAVVVPGALVGC